MWVTKHDEDDVFWSYQDLAVFLGLALPCLYCGVLIMKGALTALNISASHKALVVAPGQIVGATLLFTALAWILRLEYGRPFWRSLGWRRANYPLSRIIALGGAVALALAFLAPLLRAPELPEPMKDLLNDRASLIATAIYGVAFAPLIEELAFRGFMQPLFVRSWGVMPGILAAGVFFGLMHLPEYGYHWQYGVLIAMAGCSFGWMRWISKSTMGSTIMHAAYNLILFLGFFAGGSKTN